MKTKTETTDRRSATRKTTESKAERTRLEAIAHLKRIGAVFNKSCTRIVRVIPM